MPSLVWIAYYWPDCPIGVTAAQRSAGLTIGLQQRGWEITVITRVGSSSGCGPTLSPNGIRVVQLAERWPEPGSPWGRARQRFDEFPNAWRDAVSDWLDEHAREADLLVVSASPYTMISTAIGRGVPVAVDLRDSLIPPMAWGIRRLLTSIRRMPARLALRHVDLAVHVTPGEEARDRKVLRGVKTAVVMSASREMAAVPPETEPDAPLTVVFAGTFVPEVNSPEGFLAALADVRTECAVTATDLRFVFAGRQGEQVLEWARAKDIADLVHITGHLDRAALAAEYRRSDALLLINGHAPGVPGSKLYEYLQWDRPIVAFGGRDPWLAKFLLSEAAGVALSTPSALSVWLRAAIAEKRAGTSNYPGFRTDPVRAARHTWSERVPHLDLLLRGILR